MYQLAAYANVIEEYNDILCGIKKRYTANVILNDKSVRAIGQYAMAYYMEWTPYDVKEKLTLDILKKLKLDRIFEKYSDFPHELNQKKDMFFYAHWLYPNEIPYDIRAGVLNVYRDILDGKRRLFTMNFFADDYALERAEICLQEALKRHEFKNVQEMYELFSSEQAYDFLENYKLSKPNQMYYHSPLIFLHSALPSDLRCEFLYNYYIFLPQYKKQIDNQSLNNLT